MLAHRIKPHYYCLPILKRENDRNALLEASFNENRKFFHGNEILLHIIYRIKKMTVVVLGIFNTINSVQTITQLFENYNKIHLLKFF